MQHLLVELDSLLHLVDFMYDTCRPRDNWYGPPSTICSDPQPCRHTVALMEAQTACYKASAVSNRYLVPFSQFLLVADDVNGLLTHFVHLL